MAKKTIETTDKTPGNLTDATPSESGRGDQGETGFPLEAQTGREAAHFPQKMPAPCGMERASSDAASGFYIYIGPNLKKLIQTGTVYRGTRANALKQAAAAIEAEPLVKTLIVSGDALPEARIKVRTPGNVLYANYQKLQNGDLAGTRRSGSGGERRSKGAGGDLAERRGRSLADFATTRK